MTSRTCPWCGGKNLHITNVMGENPNTAAHQHTLIIYWEDRDCGYREKTSNDEYYDYKQSKFVPIVPPYQIISFSKPRPPLPVYMQPEYLRSGIQVSEAPKGQMVIEEEWG